MRRVVVTGMGVITPIGNSVEEFWKGIKEEKVGINPIVNFDCSQYKAKLSADVKDFDVHTCQAGTTMNEREKTYEINYTFRF